VTASGAGSAAAARAPDPEWKQEVTDRLEQFRHRRARQQGLFTPADPEDSETVPAPDLSQKVIPFEEIGAERIEPLVVELPKPQAGPVRPALPPLQRKTPRPARAETPPPQLEPVQESPEAPAARPQTAPYAVAPVALRAVAGVLDAAVTAVALGLFAGTFHLLGGSLPLQARGAAGLALAAAFVAGFYQFLYTCYIGETPGLWWTGLRVLDHDGQPPRAEQRVLRAFGVLLSGAALGLGYVWALADEEGLTWHDRMSGTFITRDTRAARHFRPR
jgi:uncharacterized RDD family membrane protein YckC